MAFLDSSSVTDKKGFIALAPRRERRCTGQPTSGLCWQSRRPRPVPACQLPEAEVRDFHSSPGPKL